MKIFHPPWLLAGFLVCATLSANQAGADDTPIVVFAKSSSVPEACESMEKIDVSAGGKWESIFRTNRGLAKKARKLLLKQAREKGGNALHLLDYRKFRAKGKRYGLERIEETAMVLDCQSDQSNKQE